MADNVFGINNPLIKGDGDPNSDSVILWSSMFDTIVFADPQFYEGISPLTGKRNYGHLGDYSEFRVLVRAHKYDGTAAYDSRTTTQILSKLRSYHGKFVYFKPHKDFSSDDDGQGTFMGDDSGDVKYFCLVVPVYLPGLPWSRNKLEIMLNLKSVDYTVITRIASATVT